MPLDLSVAPAEEPLALEDVRDFLRVDSDDEDGVISTLIRAARMDVEAFTRRALVTQTLVLRLDAFPANNRDILLPRPPLQSVSSITYTAQSDGSPTTWSSALYDVSTPAGEFADFGRVRPAYGQSWPTGVRDELEAIAITYVAGYGSGAEELDIPDGMKLAMQLMITSWYDQRLNGGAMPDAAASLLWPYRALLF